MAELCTATWLAVRINTSKELETDSLLRNERGISTFLPVEKKSYPCSNGHGGKTIKTRIRALFSGYLFAHVTINELKALTTTPKVIGVVSLRNGEPIPVPEHEILALQRLGEIGAKAEPLPYFATGTEVRVQTGPFAGVCGRVLELQNERKLVINVSSIGRSIAVDLGSAELV